MGEQKVIMERDERGRFKKIPIPPKEDLEKLYLQENKTPCEIGRKFKVSANTVRRWLHYYNIPVKRPYLSNVKTGLSETEKAYFAGYLDGDGSISIGLSKNKKSRRGVSVHDDVSLITKHKHFAQKLKELIGGTVSSFIYKDSRGKKEGYRVAFTNQASALAFLKAITSYLILKKEQADLMIEYLTKRLKARAIKGNYAPISDESWLLIEELRRLNK